MATNTPNLNLVKPTISENIDLDTLNANMDKIDLALGAPSSEILDLQTKVNGLVAPTSVTTPALIGMTVTGTPDVSLYIKKIGKSTLGQFGMNHVPSNYVRLEILLPDLAAASYVDVGTDVAIGTFSVYATFSSGAGFLNGNVMLRPRYTSTQSSIYFKCTQTLNVTNGPFTVDYGLSTTGLTTGGRHYLGADFMYEIA